MSRPFSITCILLSVAACGPGSSNTNMDMSPIMPLSDLKPEGDAQAVPVATTAVVTTADFMGHTGTLGTIKLADKTVTKAIDTTLSDNNFVRCVAGRCYVLDESKGTVRIYDPAAMWKSPIEIKTGDAMNPAAMANPHDIYPIPASTKLYVVLYNNDAAHALGIIDTTTPQMGITKWVALPAAAADKDGRPEANNIHFCAGVAYITLGDLDSKNFFAPIGPSRLAMVDVSSDMVTGIVQLMGQNPIDIATDGAGCDLVLLADAANQFGPASGNGGIERVDLSLKTSKGFVIKDMDPALLGHPSTVSTVSRKLAYSILTLTTMGSPQKVVAFDPSSGKVLGDATGQAGYIAFAKTTPDGQQLLVGINGAAMGAGAMTAGVYLGPADGSKLAGTPLNLGGSPYALSFY